MVYTGEDPNCQENTALACNDGVDNDGNGVWDCARVITGDDRHDADFNCCSMHVDDSNDCVIHDKAHEICSMTTSEPSDACRLHARALECIPPW